MVVCQGLSGTLVVWAGRVQHLRCFIMHRGPSQGNIRRSTAFGALLLLLHSNCRGSGCRYFCQHYCSPTRLLFSAAQRAGYQGLPAPLVKAILSEDNPKQSYFKLGDSIEAIAKKILRASSEGYWSALNAVMGLEREQGLFLVIDGLDKAGHEFTRGVQLFIESLQGCPSAIKVLLTSRPQADIKEILRGLPCIEYDKERKGLIALFLMP